MKYLKILDESYKPDNEMFSVLDLTGKMIYGPVDSYNDALDVARTNNSTVYVMIPLDGFNTNEELNPIFKKKVKDAYKRWENGDYARIAHRVMDDSKKSYLHKSLSKDDYTKTKEFAKKMVSDHPFKFEFDPSLEKDNYPFYVTYYADSPIYEPAEGGYYYAVTRAIASKGFNTKQEAKDYMLEFIDGDNNWEPYTNGYMIRGKYIGESEFVVIETNKTYLSQENETEPYC